MRNRAKSIPIIGYVFFILICNFAGFIGSVVTMPNIPGWYASLIKPAWNPPPWVFGPVWSLLYTFMGIAGWRIWNRPNVNHKSDSARLLFIAQLIFNILWSYLFFGLKLLGIAAVELAVLLILIVTLIRLIWNEDRIAGYLLIPYAAWVSFAGILNVTVFLLNR